MAESKMVTYDFCNESISENVHGPILYNCTKFHAFMKREHFFHIYVILNIVEIVGIYINQ